MDNLAWPINLTRTSLVCGRKPEHPEETHADTGEIVQTPHRQSPEPGIEPGTLEL